MKNKPVADDKQTLSELAFLAVIVIIDAILELQITNVTMVLKAYSATKSNMSGIPMMKQTEHNVQ